MYIRDNKYIDVIHDKYTHNYTLQKVYVSTKFEIFVSMYKI